MYWEFQDLGQHGITNLVLCYLSLSSCDWMKLKKKKKTNKINFKIKKNQRNDWKKWNFLFLNWLSKLFLYNLFFFFNFKFNVSFIYLSIKLYKNFFIEIKKKTIKKSNKIFDRKKIIMKKKYMYTNIHQSLKWYVIKKKKYKIFF